MNYAHLNANQNNSLSKFSSKLHSVTVNTKGASANVLTIYDNNKGDTSGNVVAVIDTVNLVQPTFLYDLDTLTGLSATLATGTAADVTITFQ